MKAALAPELASILQVQEMRGERLINYIRLVFVSLSLLMYGGAIMINTPLANLIFGTELSLWLLYALGLGYWFQRNPDRYVGWLKYFSILFDMAMLTSSALGMAFNHSGLLEYFYSFLPLTFVFWNLLSGLRFRVDACIFSAILVMLCNGAVLGAGVGFDMVRVSPSSVFGEPAINVTDQVLQIFFIGGPGFIAALIARSLRNLVVRAEEESMKRTRLEKEKARLGKYLSRELVDLVVASPNPMDLGGTRRTATIMFTDIRDFTPLSEGNEPERVVSLLNTYFTEMVRIVFRYGGTLDKFLGDGLMAVFGVPFPLSRSPTRAVVVALEMLAAVRDMNEATGDPRYPHLRIGVGIATGPVVAGNIGSYERMEYTCIGDTVNFASRIENLNRDVGTSILVSKETAAELDPRIPVRPVPPLRVKGKRDEVDLFAVDFAAVTDALLATLRAELLSERDSPAPVEPPEGPKRR